MRAFPPIVEANPTGVLLRTGIERADGTRLPDLEMRVPSELMGMIDPTSTPASPTLIGLAVAVGEDLTIEGSVDESLAGRSQNLANELADAWGVAPVTIEIEATHETPTRGQRVGLYFSRGVDSWAALLELADSPPGERPTDLLWVHHDDHHGGHSLNAQFMADHQRVADRYNMRVVALGSNGRALLDPYLVWVKTWSLVQLSIGLAVGGGYSRLIYCGVGVPGVSGIPLGEVPISLPPGTSGTELVVGVSTMNRLDRIRRLLAEPFARETLHVCWKGTAHLNCGRCQKCQLTMLGLAVAGDSDPSKGFEWPLDPEVLRRISIDLGPHEMTDLLSAETPPEYEEQRRALIDSLVASGVNTPRERWGDQAGPGLAGPSAPARVAQAIRATTGNPDGQIGGALGWRTGFVPLRPALEDHARVRAATATNRLRPRAWAVIESHIRAGHRDGRQVELAQLMAESHGAGISYHPGILWAVDEPPALARREVAALLFQARVRLWWRDEGDFDPLRVVESFEVGCLPMQVMPSGRAQDLAADLPEALAPLIVDAAELTKLDLSPDAVEKLLMPAVDHLLASSAEFDLFSRLVP